MDGPHVPGADPFPSSLGAIFLPLFCASRAAEIRASVALPPPTSLPHTWFVSLAASLSIISFPPPLFSRFHTLSSWFLLFLLLTFYPLSRSEIIDWVQVSHYFRCSCSYITAAATAERDGPAEGGSAPVFLLPLLHPITLLRLCKMN